MGRGSEPRVGLRGWAASWGPCSLTPRPHHLSRDVRPVSSAASLECDRNRFSVSGSLPPLLAPVPPLPSVGTASKAYPESLISFAPLCVPITDFFTNYRPPQTPTSSNFLEPPSVGPMADSLFSSGILGPEMPSPASLSSSSGMTPLSGTTRLQVSVSCSAQPAQGI